MGKMYLWAFLSFHAKCILSFPAIKKSDLHLAVGGHSWWVVGGGFSSRTERDREGYSILSVFSVQSTVMGISG